MGKDSKTKSNTDGEDEPKSRKLAQQAQKIKIALTPGSIAKPEPEPARRERVKRAVTQMLKPVRYVVEPSWGPPDRQGGATSMRVVIGPMQGAPGQYGSKPAPNTPPVMRKLLDGEHASHAWIAGHLLNDNLGGPGVLDNLTPLTTAGNKNHLHLCETSIKNFISAAYSRTENKRDTHWYGVYYAVDVDPVKWDANDPVLQHVAKQLTVTAYPVCIDKQRPGVYEAVAQADCPIGCWFEPVIAQKVDNAGYEALGPTHS